MPENKLRSEHPEAPTSGCTTGENNTMRIPRYHADDTVSSAKQRLLPVDRLELHRELDRLIDSAPDFGRITLAAKLHRSTLAQVRGTIARTVLGRAAK